VQGDGDGDRDAEPRVLVGGEEGREALGKVVHADGKRGDQADALETFVGDEVLGIFLQVGDVRILHIGDQAVDAEDEEHTAEEADHGDPVAAPAAVHLVQHLGRFGKHLDERDVDHHARRETERGREDSLVAVAGEEGDQAADAGREAGDGREREGDPGLCIHGLLSPERDCCAGPGRFP
jgi:hypothetical protein